MQTLRLCPYVEVKKEIKLLNESKGSQEKMSQVKTLIIQSTVTFFQIY